MSRETTKALWNRVIARLIALTRDEAIQWDDTDVPGTYITATGSGAITVATQFDGTGNFGLPIELDIASIIGSQIVLTMDDARGETTSLVRLRPTETMRDIAMAKLLDEMDHELYLAASELVELIAASPSRATAVADSILDDLAD